MSDCTPVMLKSTRRYFPFSLELSSKIFTTSPYEDPKNPDLILNTEKESIEESVKKLENFIIKEFGMTNNS